MDVDAGYCLSFFYISYAIRFGNSESEYDRMVTTTTPLVTEEGDPRNLPMLPLLAAKPVVSVAGSTPPITSSFQDHLMMKFERVTSTITTYSFSTTTILKALQIATDPGVLLCIPDEFVLC